MPRLTRLKIARLENIEELASIFAHVHCGSSIRTLDLSEVCDDIKLAQLQLFAQDGYETLLSIPACFPNLRSLLLCGPVPKVTITPPFVSSGFHMRRPLNPILGHLLARLFAKCEEFHELATEGWDLDAEAIQTLTESGRRLRSLCLRNFNAATDFCGCLEALVNLESLDVTTGPSCIIRIPALGTKLQGTRLSIHCTITHRL